MSFDLNNFTIAAPLLALAAGALVILLLDLLLPAQAAQPWWYLAGIGAVVLSGVYLAPLWGGTGTAFGGALLMDRMAVVFAAILLVCALLTFLLSSARSEEDKSGYLALVLWGAMGMIVMAGAGNLMTVFLGLELLSLALYVAVGFDPAHRHSRESALKYFVLGSVASAFILFGFALIYGTVGSMDLVAIAKAANGNAQALYYKVGIALALVGFAFKLALVPFHSWAPDVYQGAPTATTAFMSVGTKGAAFAMLARFLLAAVPSSAAGAYLLPLAVLAALSMILGASVGMWQKDLKRLMAYSGIAHAGYLVMAIPTLGSEGLTAAAYYMAAYGFTAMGIFAIIEILEVEGTEGASLESFRSMYYKRPGLAVAMSLFMFALAGLPPTGGFIGKFLLAKAAVAAPAAVMTPAWVVLIALMISTGISAYVYLGVIGTMFRKPAADLRESRSVMAGAQADVALSPGTVRLGLQAVLWIAVVGTVLLGVLPGPVMDLVRIVIK